MSEHKAYKAMADEARARKMPEHYRADLYKHDRDWLRQADPTECFVWYLYPRGTHLLRLDQCCPWRGKLRSADLLRQIVQDFPGGRVYFWNATTATLEPREPAVMLEQLEAWNAWRAA